MLGKIFQFDGYVQMVDVSPTIDTRCAQSTFRGPGFLEKTSQLAGRTGDQIDMNTMCLSE